jgi:hypothetical protein
VQRRYGLDQKTLFAKLRKGLAPLNFDVDSKKQAKVVLRRLKRRFKAPKYIILKRKSSSGRGYHFFVFTAEQKQLFLPARKVLRIRKAVGDCYGRLKADECRAKAKLPISILFHHKNLKTAGVIEECE